METILFYNQCVPFDSFIEHDFGFTLKDGTHVDTFVRDSVDPTVPVTVKLVEFFKSCGVDAVVTAEIGESFRGPSIWLGFESFSAVASSHVGYLDVSNFYLTEKLFEDLEALDNFNVALRLDIENLINYEKGSKFILKPEVSSHVIEMEGGYKYFEPYHAICIPFNLPVVEDKEDFDDKLLQNWTRKSSNWKITFSMSLILTPKPGTERPDQSVTDHLTALKKLRTDDTFSDFTIIAGSGAEIKCHRNILAAQSSYFARLLQSGMKEATSGTVQLSGMTEAGVGAMLDYLYTWKKAVPEVNADVCVELLEAGHKYDIQPMEKCMEQILRSKPTDWFTPEAAFQLVLFLKDLAKVDLKVKAKKVYKARFAEIQSLPAYEELFKEDSLVLKELFEYLLTD